MHVLLAFPTRSRLHRQQPPLHERFHVNGSDGAFRLDWPVFACTHPPLSSYLSFVASVSSAIAISRAFRCDTHHVSPSFPSRRTQHDIFFRVIASIAHVHVVRLHSIATYGLHVACFRTPASVAPASHVADRAMALFHARSLRLSLRNEREARVFVGSFVQTRWKRSSRSCFASRLHPRGSRGGNIPPEEEVHHRDQHRGLWREGPRSAVRASLNWRGYGPPFGAGGPDGVWQLRMGPTRVTPWCLRDRDIEGGSSSSPSLLGQSQARVEEPRSRHPLRLDVVFGSLPIGRIPRTSMLPSFLLLLPGHVPVPQMTVHPTSSSHPMHLTCLPAPPTSDGSLSVGFLGRVRTHPRAGEGVSSP